MSQEISKGLQEYSEEANKNYNVCAWSSVHLVENGEHLNATMYRLDKNRYYVTDDGLIFLEGLYDYELSDQVLDPAIIKAVETKVEEDKIIAGARDKVAEILSEDNELLQKILRVHIEYNRGSVSKYTVEDQGITFYPVGQNASHQFYLGVKDGRLYRRSEGEALPDEDEIDENGEYEFKVESHVLEIEDPTGSWGYVGHY